MAQTVITSAFERYKAQEAAGGRRIVLDQFIFANIPGLDPSASPGRDDPIPDDSLIVWRQNADASGMVSEDVVTYAVTLPESAGDFAFNWMGLLNSESGTLCHITTLETQHKTRTADGRQGNVLTYSVNLKFSGASEQTGITTPVSTWQIDFSARLHGMDEAARLAMLDLYGSALFFDDAFRMRLTAPGSATLSPGTAWLRGLRVVLGHPATLTFPAGNELVISLDCALTGSLTGENQAVFTLVSTPLRDYIDALGFAHYVEPVARIAADGTLTDLRRTGKPISQQLNGEFLTVAGNLKEIAARGQQAQRMLRTNIGLGNSATLNVGTAEGTVAAGNDTRITGAMQKENCGRDIPDKSRFVREIGLADTIQRAAHIIAASGDVTGSAWGGLLSSWLNNQLTARDRNINTRASQDQMNTQLAIRDANINARATRDWVNQNFANKSTATFGLNGWFRDASTGFMIQWGTHPGGSATYTVNLPQPFPNVGLWALGWVAGALWYENDDWSNSAGLINNSQIRVTTDHSWSTAWIAIGY
ncbi:TPA: phage tail protein [Salmonella enterica subsp. salamae serovar 28:r:e,n,z15]|nr:phage tail protein [Salmonella enterica subsp. salamae serovar 28:r:e,n,z15]